MLGFTSSERAYLAPFAAFLGCLLAGQVVSSLGDGSAAWPLATPQYWVYPLQTILCTVLLWQGWKHYPLGWPRGAHWGVAAGVLVWLLWVAPQMLLHLKPRTAGFDPWFFPSRSVTGLNLGLRFIRLVIVVPLLEEVFWRGYLMRVLIQPDFQRVPIGAFAWRAFIITALGFCFEHQMADWPAAFLAGVIYNGVALVTRSLASCVLAHAVTNLLLGIYVLETGQFGFW